MPVLKNRKHELFAQEVAKGAAGAAAYKKAGYTFKAPDVGMKAASRLLNSVDVQARVKELQTRAAEKTEITIASVITELAKIGFSNMEAYFRSNEDGDPVLDFSTLTSEQKAAMSEITVETYLEGRGEDARTVKKVKFKLHDKKGALVDIGRHLGAFRDKLEISGPNGGPVETANLHMTPAQAQEAYANLLKNANALSGKKE